MITKAHVEQRITIVLEMDEGDDVTSVPFAMRKDALWNRIVVQCNYPLTDPERDIHWTGTGHYINSDGKVGKARAHDQFGRFRNLPESVKDHVRDAIRTVADKMTEVEL